MELMKRGMSKIPKTTRLVNVISFELFGQIVKPFPMPSLPLVCYVCNDDTYSSFLERINLRVGYLDVKKCRVAVIANRLPHFIAGGGVSVTVSDTEAKTGDESNTGTAVPMDIKEESKTLSNDVEDSSVAVEDGLLWRMIEEHFPSGVGNSFSELPVIGIQKILFANNSTSNKSNQR